MGCATFKSRSLPGYLMSGEVERGEALSTAGCPNLVRCAPNGTVVGPGVARDWPAQTSSKIYRELFQPSIVLVCGDAGSLGSGARGVTGCCCGRWRTLFSSRDWPACPTSWHGRWVEDDPGCARLLLLPLGDWTGWVSILFSPKPPANGSSVSLPPIPEQRFGDTGHSRADDITSAHPCGLDATTKSKQRI